jgi:chromosome segregation ATPase
MDTISLISLLLGGGSFIGLIVGIVTIPSAIKKAAAEAKKAAAEARKEEAEAKTAELNNMKSVADGWKELAEERQEANNEKDARITELTGQVDARYVEIGEWRDKYNHSQEENAQLRVENTKLMMTKCVKPGCLDREPPTGY